MPEIQTPQTGPSASNSPQAIDPLVDAVMALSGGSTVKRKNWGPSYFDITVQNRQTIEDIALQVYGATEGVLQLLMDNRYRLTGGITTKLYFGMNLRVRKGVVLNREVVDTFIREGIIPANGDLSPPPVVGPDYNDDYNDDYYT